MKIANRLLNYLTDSIRYIAVLVKEKKIILFLGFLILLGSLAPFVAFSGATNSLMTATLMVVVVVILYISSVWARVLLYRVFLEKLKLAGSTNKFKGFLTLLRYDVITALILSFFSLLSLVPGFIGIFNWADNVKLILVLGFYALFFVISIWFAIFYLTAWYFTQFEAFGTGVGVLKSFKSVRKMFKRDRGYMKGLLFLIIASAVFFAASFFGWPLSLLGNSIDLIMIAPFSVMFASLLLMVLLTVVLICIYSFTYLLVNWSLLGYWAYCKKKA